MPHDNTLCSAFLFVIQDPRCTLGRLCADLNCHARIDVLLPREHPGERQRLHSLPIARQSIGEPAVEDSLLFVSEILLQGS